MRRSNPIDLHPLAAEFASTTFIVPHFGAGMLREALTALRDEGRADAATCAAAIERYGLDAQRVPPWRA